MYIRLKQIMCKMNETQIKHIACDKNADKYTFIHTGLYLDIIVAYVKMQK